MKISEEGIRLIKHFEGCKLLAYQDSVGVWTIGWGHTKEVFEGMEVSQKDADAMFLYELEEYENYINRTGVELNQNQFDALVSWVYNLGPANLVSSTMLKRLKSGEYWDVPTQMKRWNKAGGTVLKGLTLRRNAEALMFEGKEWNVT